MKVYEDICNILNNILLSSPPLPLVSLPPPFPALSSLPPVYPPLPLRSSPLPPRPLHSPPPSLSLPPLLPLSSFSLLSPSPHSANCLGNKLYQHDHNHPDVDVREQVAQHRCWGNRFPYIGKLGSRSIGKLGQLPWMFPHEYAAIFFWRLQLLPHVASMSP